MSDDYALMQTDLELPDQDALARAFHGSGVLTAFDAQTMRRDAYGILVSKLTRDNAMKLASTLAREGIRVEMVDRAHLPQLAAPKTLRRLDCLSDTCRIYDPLGRPIDVAWGHIQLVASGIFKTRQTRREAMEKPLLLKEVSRMSDVTPDVEYRTREEWVGTPVVELTLTGSVIRYTLNPFSFRYDYLGDRKADNAEENWVRLMHDLKAGTPGALWNRGAESLLHHPPVPWSYPSQNAFEEECIWLLWRAGVRPKRG